MSDTPRTDAAAVNREFIVREMDIYSQKFVLADVARQLERDLSTDRETMRHWKNRAEQYETALLDIEMETRRGGQWTPAEINEVARAVLGPNAWDDRRLTNAAPQMPATATSGDDGEQPRSYDTGPTVRRSAVAAHAIALLDEAYLLLNSQAFTEEEYQDWARRYREYVK